MTELEELRRRAYGPDPEALDREALERLRQLEEAGKPPRMPRPEVHHELPPLQPTTELVEAETPEPPRREWLRTLGRAARWFVGRVRRIRRSTALISLSVAVVATLVITALVLVERVQTDPLGVGAEQVARLSVNSRYEIPAFYAVTAAQGGTVEGFQEFYGLTSVVTTGGFGYFSAGGNDRVCLNVYSTKDMKPDGDSFSGLLLGGCAAGGFPAVAQFELGDQSVPAELIAAFPDSSALQFVYDSEHREVVVFATE